MPSLANTEDEDIVGRIIRGETELFAELVGRYQKKVFNIGMMFFRNHDDASDFAQEVFLRAYNSLASFQGRSRFVYWLTKVAYNHGINAVKGSRSAESLVEHSLQCEGATPEEAHLREEVARALRKAVMELPEHYRVCVDFHFFYGLTHAEISGITGFPVNTVKSHVFRAKQMLRDALHGTIAEDYHEM
ncbi:MAG: sigma-70 family RNA polymerase sigma factor [Spirochaetes bacterium]|nr:sigma-70 family RNA polymerase sigma factor [Spirochaetota bacterium]HPA71832.1 sigma-70 family RNA polymerase sigma factor [Spirochaetota bacterium]